jgi:hypothetical protein
VYPALKEAYTASAFDFGNDFGMWQSKMTDILRQMLESDKVTSEVVARVSHGNWMLPEGEVWAMVLSRRNVDEYINTFRLRPEGVRNCERAVLYPVEGKALDYFNEGPCENVTKELFKLKNHTPLFAGCFFAPFTLDTTPSSPHLKKMKTILIVEDNPTNQRLFFDVLQAYGAHPIKAFDAKEALRILSQTSALSDIHMYGISYCYHCKETGCDPFAPSSDLLFS